MLIKVIILIGTVVFLLPSSLFAEKQGSYIKFSCEYAKDNSKALGASVALGLSESFLITYEHLTLLRKNDSRSYDNSVGLYYNPTDNLGLSFSATLRHEPINITGRGGEAGFTYALNSLWDGEKLSYLKASFSLINWRKQSIKPEPGIMQRSWTIGLAQELTNEALLNLSYSKFAYNFDLNKINYIAQKDGRYQQVASVVFNFPKDYAYIYFTYQITEKYNLGLFASRVRTAVDDLKVYSLGLMNEYSFAKSWFVLGLSPSYSWAAVTKSWAVLLTTGFNF